MIRCLRESKDLRTNLGVAPALVPPLLLGRSVPRMTNYHPWRDDANWYARAFWTLLLLIILRIVWDSI
jgi:hypothetical protein